MVHPLGFRAAYNYASVIMGAWVFIGAIYYFFYQRHTYMGPLDIVGDEVIGDGSDYIVS